MREGRKGATVRLPYLGGGVCDKSKDSDISVLEWELFLTEDVKGC